MSDISPLKQNLQEEDLRSGAAASESTMDKVGSSVNFWNDRYEGVRYWVLNGGYSIIPVPDDGVDGFIFCPYDMEIFGFSMGALKAGTSGSSEIDIVKDPVGGGSAVSIFTQRPIIPYTSGDRSFVQIESVPSYSIVRASAGVTAPTLVSTQLSKGDVLSMNWVSKQVGGEGLTVGLFTRPRA